MFKVCGRTGSSGTHLTRSKLSGGGPLERRKRCSLPLTQQQEEGIKAAWLFEQNAPMMCCSSAFCHQFTSALLTRCWFSSTEHSMYVTAPNVLAALTVCVGVGIQKEEQNDERNESTSTNAHLLRSLTSTRQKESPSTVQGFGRGGLLPHLFFRNR